MAKQIDTKVWSLTVEGGVRKSKPTPPVVDPPVDPPGGGVVPGAILDFAYIPEIVFVRGISEYEDLSIAPVDPFNRVEPGNMAWETNANVQRHPHDGGGLWTASEETTLVPVSGDTLNGVSWNSTYCRLEYNGYGPGTGDSFRNQTGYYKLRASSGIESNVFPVRILTPTIVYGVGVAALVQSKGWATNNPKPPKQYERNYTNNVTYATAAQAMDRMSDGVTWDNPNVLYITGGTYKYMDGERLWKYAGSSPGNAPHVFYMLGDPANHPYFDYKQSATSVASYDLSASWSVFAYFKNFKARLVQLTKGNSWGLEQEAQYGRPGYKCYFTKVDHFRAQEDAINPTTLAWTAGANNGVSTPADETWSGSGGTVPGTEMVFWHYRNSNWGGNGNTRHGMYIEGRPFSWCRWNNVLMDGAWNGSTFQATVAKIALLNSRQNMVSRETTHDTWMGWLPTDMYDTHACSWKSVFNNWCEYGYNGKPTGSNSLTGRPANNTGTSNGPIFYENRRANSGGNDLPPYPNVTWQTIGYNVTALEPFTINYETVGVGGTLGDLGTVRLSTTRDGPRTVIANKAVYSSSTSNLKNWDVTVDPSEVSTGQYYVWITSDVTGEVQTQIKTFKVYKTATELAVTNFWEYDYGTVDGWDYDSLGTFINPAFWSSVAAKDIRSPFNPHTYKQYWAFNVFENVQFGDSPTWPAGQPLVRNKGLSPAENLGLFSLGTHFRRAPSNYVERACAFFLNNRLINATRYGQGEGVTSGLFEVKGSPHATLQKGTLDQCEFEKGNLWNQAQLLTTNGGNWPTVPNYPNTDGPGFPDRQVVDVGGNNFDANIPKAPVEIPYWFNFSDPTEIRTTAPKPYIQTVSETLTAGQTSPALDIPSLNAREPRLDPYNEVGSDYPSSVGGTKDLTTGIGNDPVYTRAWIWGSKLCWDPVRKMIVGIVGPHLWDTPEFGPVGNKWQNQYNSILFTYSAIPNRVQTYEAPLNYTDPMSGFASHMFDNNEIVTQSDGKRILYKPTQPVWEQVGGWIQPQVVGIDLDKITTNYASVRNGAAFHRDLGKPTSGDGNNITGNALAYHAALDRLYMFHKNRFWFYSFATNTWSTENLLPFPGTSLNGEIYYAYHNLANYNPTSEYLVMGGGAADPLGSLNSTPPVRNLNWAAVKPDGAVIQLDNSPVCMSVFNDSTAVKAAACASPKAGDSRHFFFHDNGNVYSLDPTKPSGSQWVIEKTALLDTTGVKVEPVDWVCPIPEYGVIAIGCYGGYGTNHMHLFKV